jgi:hypothetical protein
MEVMISSGLDSALDRTAEALAACAKVSQTARRWTLHIAAPMLIQCEQERMTRLELCLHRGLRFLRPYTYWLNASQRLLRLFLGSRVSAPGSKRTFVLSTCHRCLVRLALCGGATRVPFGNHGYQDSKSPCLFGATSVHVVSDPFLCLPVHFPKPCAVH